jgi:hypothetical protein
MNEPSTGLGSEPPQEALRRGVHRPKPIVFFCSNGHRIVVDAALAGKRGRCRECKQVVTIPLSDGSAGPAPDLTIVGQPPEVAAVAGAAFRTGGQEEAAGLDSPSLIINEPPPPPRRPASPPRGVPASTIAASTAERARAAAGEPPSAAREPGVRPPLDPAEVRIDLGQGSSPLSLEPASLESPEVDHPHVFEELQNPTARLMERLWYERRHGGVIEVHLTGAVSPILPTYFYPAWSDGSHGLFASLAADGTVTLTAVAWDSVQKIVVRHVDSIPPDFLDIGLEE